MLKKGIFALLFMLTLTSCVSTKWLSGKWNGTGVQIDKMSWRVELDAENMKKIKIDYPSLACGGDWKIMTKSENLITFKENISYGVDKCDQGVEAFVKKISENEIEVTYYLRSYDPKNPIATAKLKRSN